MVPSQSAYFTFLLLFSSVLCSAHRLEPAMRNRLFNAGVGASWQWGSNGEPGAGPSHSSHSSSGSGYVSGGANLPLIPLPEIPIPNFGNVGGGGGEPLYCTPLSCHQSGNKGPCTGYGLYFDSGEYRPIYKNWANENTEMMSQGEHHGFYGGGGATQEYPQGHISGAMAPESG